jgi:hypothetical protein
MLNIAKSNIFMDWQKYPKNEKSSRIPETLDSQNVLPHQGWEIALHFF